MKPTTNEIKKQRQKAMRAARRAGYPDDIVRLYSQAKTSQAIRTALLNAVENGDSGERQAARKRLKQLQTVQTKAYSRNVAGLWNEANNY